MDISQQYIAALIVVITSVLGLLKISYDITQLTQIIMAVVTLVSGVWIMYRRYKQGDITVVGTMR